MPHEKATGALLSAMEKQAAEERAAIVSGATARAAEILAAADAECARLRGDAFQVLDKELLTERQRLLGDAVMRMRAERLHMKRRLMAEVFRRAAEEIERRRASDGYAAVLDVLAAEARRAVGEPCTVSVAAETGAVLASSPDGRRRVDNGPAARLRHAQASEEHEVARRLFRATNGAR